MHKLFARQLVQARNGSGEVDLDALKALIVAEYEQQDRDRRRTDRSISLMIQELDELNRGLERLVEERTARLCEREAELQSQNVRFETAINNMTQALLMFDASGRLMISNRRFRDMYGLPSDVVQPGRTIYELLEARRAAGAFAGNVKQYADEILASIADGRTDSRLAELPDGRTIAILNYPMPGGGWVATHEDITERRRAEKRIAYLACHDSLTDLPNRMQFREQLGEAVARAQRDERVAVLYLDLDRFKNVNDTLGHPLGDELLKAVAARLRRSVRDVDTVARVGGDEFAIIHVGVERPTEIATLARRVCEAVRAPYNLNGHVVIVDTCIGIAIAPGDGSEPDELLKNADMALYGAKGDGRGTYRFFEPAMDARVKARRELEIALRDAYTGGQFELHYQPVLDLHSGSVACCEALLRWNQSGRGKISPAEFVPVAEEIGLIVPIGEWVLKRACADATRWPANVKVAVNLSPIQVMHPNLVPTVMQALAAAGLPANRLELEITETVLMQNTDMTLSALHRLRELGIAISMDDFGTGYSSLSYLRSFPFNKIKIDRSFISGLPGEDSIAIVRAVTALANNLGMATTAEGVETEAQLEQVLALGCTEMQGYLFSAPRAEREIARLLAPRELMLAKSA